MSIYPLPALLTPIPVIPFTTEKITGWTNEAAKGDNKTPRNSLFYFSILCFTVLVTPPINATEYSNDFIVLIILFISPFKIK